MKVLRHLPSGVILGRKFLIAVKLNLDPSTGLGSFRRRIDGKFKENSGKILTPAEDLLQIMDSNGSGYDTSGHHSDLDPLITEIK